MFDADWKEEVEDSVNDYSSFSEKVADALLSKKIECNMIIVSLNYININIHTAVGCFQVYFSVTLS